jgi:hypothetical protein
MITGTSIVYDDKDKLKILYKERGIHVLKEFTPDIDFSKILVTWIEDVDLILKFLEDSPFEELSGEVKELWLNGDLYPIEVEFDPIENNFYII